MLRRTERYIQGRKQLGFSEHRSRDVASVIHIFFIAREFVLICRLTRSCQFTLTRRKSSKFLSFPHAQFFSTPCTKIPRPWKLQWLHRAVEHDGMQSWHHYRRSALRISMPLEENCENSLADFVDDLLEEIGEFLDDGDRLPRSEADAIKRSCGVILCAAKAGWDTTASTPFAVWPLPFVAVVSPLHKEMYTPIYKQEKNKIFRSWRLRVSIHSIPQYTAGLK